MSSINIPEILTTIDPPALYVVEGMLYESQMLVIAGEAGVGKSFLNYNLSMALATGCDFLGMRTKQSKVLYFDEENSRMDLTQYLRQVWRGLGCPDKDILANNLIIRHFDLSIHKTDRYEYMGKLAKAFQPMLIVIDTATTTCGIEDENSNGEATEAVRGLRAVMAAGAPGCAMIILKHTKFNHDITLRTTIRGAKAWLDQADGTIFHKLAVGKPRSDGLRNSRLVRDKVRAFGLSREVIIIPEWLGQEEALGVVLKPAAPVSSGAKFPDRLGPGS
jgi:hypothetical protein